MHVILRSRGGNLLLASVGALYTVCALSLLVWFVSDSWSAALGLIDRAFIAALIASTACGVWFVLIGRGGMRSGPHISANTMRHTSTGTSNAASIQR